MLDASYADANAPITRSPGYWATVWRRFRRDPVAVCALVVILLLVLVAIFAPLIAPHDPYRGMTLRRLRPPGTEGFPLGTDELGRDMLSRLIFGARLSLFMGVTPVLLALFLGSAIGLTAGYVGGLVNTLLMRTIDVFFAFPSVLLAVALSGALGAGIANGLDIADRRLHPADRARGRERDDERAHPRLCGSRARQRRWGLLDRPRTTCSATCWGPSSSTP